MNNHGHNMKALSLGSWQACCSSCSHTSGCKGWTFVYNKPSGDNCYLKDSIGVSTPDDHVISGSIPGMSALEFRSLSSAGRQPQCVWDAVKSGNNMNNGGHNMKSFR